MGHWYYNKTLQCYYQVCQQLIKRGKRRDAVRSGFLAEVWLKVGKLDQLFFDEFGEDDFADIETFFLTRLDEPDDRFDAGEIDTLFVG